jgi:hypothetical protein
MPQGTLSAANAVQAKTGSLAGGNPASVALDNPCQQGSTVTIEIQAAGSPLTSVGTVPDGWELDANSVDTNTVNLLLVFRKRQVAAGEQSWDFGYISNFISAWRVTEWDTTLEPMSPLEAVTAFATSGTGPTTLSTGTTATTSRAGVVCLAWHHWQRALATAQSMTFSGHTNGFTIRDELRFTGGTDAEYADCWSWKFSEAAGSFETTATINLATRNALDLYVAQMVVYAPMTYA